VKTSLFYWDRKLMDRPKVCGNIGSNPRKLIIKRRAIFKQRLGKGAAEGGRGTN